MSSLHDRPTQLMDRDFSNPGRSRDSFVSTLVVLLGVLAGCGDGVDRLVERGEAASVREQIDLGEDSRAALTPPFPATVTFEVSPPPAAFLRFAPALVMEQNVRRARVEFVVEIESRGTAVEIYRELFRFQESNQWHERLVSLGPWGGEPVRLHLRTEIADGRTEALWAPRLRAVWGEPVVDTSVIRHIDASLRAWLVRGGAGPEELERLYRLALALMLGGPLGLVVRALFLRYSSSNVTREFADSFPMFTLVTIVVIAVVRSSLALSLGLIGAVSIVRFRTAIKTTEELSYILFCVAVGLALGAGQPMLAVTAVVLVSAAVALSRRVAYQPTYEKRLMLTISGEADDFFGAGESGDVLERIGELSKRFRFQRLDQIGARVELRGVVTVDDDDAEALVSRLRERLPALRFTYADMKDIS